MGRRIRKRKRRTRKSYRGGGLWDNLKNLMGRGATTAKNKAGNIFGRFFRKGETDAAKKDCSEDLRRLSEKINNLIQVHLKKPVDVEKAVEVAAEVQTAVDDTLKDVVEPIEPLEPDASPKDADQEDDDLGDADPKDDDLGDADPKDDAPKDIDEKAQMGGRRRKRRRRTRRLRKRRRMRKSRRRR